MDALETRIPPPVWAAVAGLLTWAVSTVADDVLNPDWARPAAVVVAVLGMGTSVAGLAQFARHDTTFDPHALDDTSALVTSGVYRVTRNPMYVGLLSLVVAVGLWTGSVIALAVGGGFLVAVLTRLQIIPEERMLAEKFGDDYEAFRTRTRRWIW